MPLSASSLNFDLVILVLIVWVLVRQLRERTMKVGRLWILPLLMTYLSAKVILPDVSLTPMAPVYILLGLVIGALFGYVRGTLVQVRLGDRPGEVLTKGSPVAVIVWIVLIALKYVMRLEFGAGTSHVTSSVLTAALLAVSLGSVYTRRLVLYLKYRQIAR